MKVLIIAPPFLKDYSDKDSWITIPSASGYGGIEAVVFALMNGLVHYGCEVTLIGAPGSLSFNGLTVIRDIRGAENVRSWIMKNHKNFDIIHDHSCGRVFNGEHKSIEFPYIATHHETIRAPFPRNTVYLSYAQREQANYTENTVKNIGKKVLSYVQGKYTRYTDAPIVRIPIMFNNYYFNDSKEDYFLYLGRVAEWKGVYETAQICKQLNTKLVIAGPAWEKEYFDKIITDFPEIVDYIGEISGIKKIDLLARAKGLFVLSRFGDVPWGGKMCEPGATVVGEAAACGTPVISSTNGCLAEIVVPETGIQLMEDEIENLDVLKLQSTFPSPIDAFTYGNNHWNHIVISNEYMNLYKKIIDGANW